jgi:hypothetical protein
MTAKILFIKHIHSCFASASSNDVWVGIELEQSEFPHPVQEPEKPNAHHDFFSLMAASQMGQKIDMDKRIETEGSIISFPGHFLDGEMVSEIVSDPEYPQYMKVYLLADKTFHDKGLREARSKRGFSGYSDTPEFKALVQSYVDKGWNPDYREYEDLKAFEKFQEDKELYKRSEKELVLWNYGKDDFQVSQYQGGFSDIFYKGKVQKYCEGGGVFGWMGDISIRTRSLDKVFESEFVARGLSLDPLRVWVTSTDARHYADSLYGMNSTEQEMKIKKDINRIYNLGLIFGDPRHKGTYGSTQEVRVQLEEEGKLLKEID